MVIARIKKTDQLTEAQAWAVVKATMTGTWKAALARHTDTHFVWRIV